MESEAKKDDKRAKNEHDDDDGAHVVTTIVRNASDSSSPPMSNHLALPTPTTNSTESDDKTAVPSPPVTTTRPLTATSDGRTVSFSTTDHAHPSNGPSQLENGLALTNSTGASSYKSRTALIVDDQARKLAALGHETELARNFDFWASMGIGIANIGALQGTFLSILTAYAYGGPSMYSIAWPISGLLFCSLAAILGEMASTYPVAGAMFTWTFRLARSSKRLNHSARYLSWIVASFLLAYHVLVQIVITWQVAHTISDTVTLHHIDFQPTTAQTLAICWAVLIFCACVVSAPISRSPWLWRILGGGIVAGFVIMNVVLLVKAPEIRPAKFVFTTYANESGWSSKGYVYMIGWCLTCVAVGMEACAHVAEDTKRPSRTVPMAMFWATFTSYTLGWISICVLLATTQPDNLDSRLDGSIAIFANTLSRPLTTFVCIVIILSQLAQNVAQLLATSRFIWALARERAIPFSLTFFRLAKSTRQPLNAIWVVVLIAIPSLGLLEISTRIISTILLEGAAWSVMAAMWLPVAIYLICPEGALTGDGRAEWTLRRFSKPLAFVVSAFALTFLIVLCLPTAYPVTALNASYAAVVAVGIWLLASLTWILYGNARYAGPIKATTKWTIGAEIELPSSGANGKNGTSRGAAAAGYGPSKGAGGAAAAAGAMADGTSVGYPRIGETTSEMHGKTARVFWSSTLDAAVASNDDPHAHAHAHSRGVDTLDFTSSFASDFTGRSSEYDDDDDDDEEDSGSEGSSSYEDEESRSGRQHATRSTRTTADDNNLRVENGRTPVVRTSPDSAFRERVARLGAQDNVMTP